MRWVIPLLIAAALVLAGCATPPAPAGRRVPVAAPSTPTPAPPPPPLPGTVSSSVTSDGIRVSVESLPVVQLQTDWPIRVVVTNLSRNPLHVGEYRWTLSVGRIMGIASGPSHGPRGRTGPVYPSLDLAPGESKVETLVVQSGNTIGLSPQTVPVTVFVELAGGLRTKPLDVRLR